MTIAYESVTEIESFIKFEFEQKIPLKFDIDKRYWKDRERLMKYHTYNSEKIIQENLFNPST